MTVVVAPARPWFAPIEAWHLCAALTAGAAFAAELFPLFPLVAGAAAYVTGRYAVGVDVRANDVAVVGDAVVAGDFSAPVRSLAGATIGSSWLDAGDLRLTFRRRGRRTTLVVPFSTENAARETLGRIALARARRSAVVCVRGPTLGEVARAIAWTVVRVAAPPAVVAAGLRSPFALVVTAAATVASFVGAAFALRRIEPWVSLRRRRDRGANEWRPIYEQLVRDAFRALDRDRSRGPFRDRGAPSAEPDRTGS